MKTNNSNFIFAVILLVGFFFVWETVVMKKYAPNPKTAQPVAAAKSSTPSTMSAGTDPYNVTPRPADAQGAVAQIKTEDTDITFDSIGGAVTSWKIMEKDRWLELVLPKTQRVHAPLDTFPEINFRVSKKTATSIQFSGQLPSGVIVEKNIQLLAHPPFHSLTLTFKNPTKVDQAAQTDLGWGDGLGKTTVGDPKSDVANIAEMRALGLAGDRIRSWKAGLIFNRDINRVDPGPFKWVAIDNHHFLAALISPEISHSHIIVHRKSAPYIGIPIQINLKPGESRTLAFDLYVGPKAYSTLLKTEDQLWKAVDFGIFGVIAKMLLRSLNFFHSLTKNYGWAIILLTLCIQGLVFPLTRKSLAHSVKMKELQPHLKKIQEQFKSDPKRLQVETMNFYRKNGMKLMGMEGCLPIMLQIPIFIAFYTTLNAAYELRGAPWILWIHDLGAHDPYYVLPVLMGIGMFFQQKATAAPAADPTQAKMMMFMPLIFTFMFFKLPAGLVLYWCVNSLTTIVIQRVMMKNLHRPQAVV